LSAKVLQGFRQDKVLPWLENESSARVQMDGADVWHVLGYVCDMAAGGAACLLLMADVLLGFILHHFNFY
jgi:hypothetical protein